MRSRAAKSVTSATTPIAAVAPDLADHGLDRSLLPTVHRYPRTVFGQQTAGGISDTPRAAGDLAGEVGIGRNCARCCFVWHLASFVVFRTQDGRGAPERRVVKIVVNTT
jgi:hypothetical protein